MVKLYNFFQILYCLNIYEVNYVIDNIDKGTNIGPILLYLG